MFTGDTPSRPKRRIVMGDGPRGASLPRPGLFILAPDGFGRS